MAKITLDIPDTVIARVVDAIAARQGYTGAGGQTKASFAKAWLAESLRAEVRAHEGGRAAEASRIAAEEKANADVTIT